VVMRVPNPLVISVEPGTLAAELGLQEGDQIVRVNGREIRDLIQFQLEWAGEEVVLEVQKSSGEVEAFEIEKDYDEPLGVAFDRAVFDGIRVCQNKCQFCFVDQMPLNMRPTLYVKDDDYRLSFLQGSFVTLTNLKEKDLQRIKAEHLSPLYVSVHTTDAKLRQELLKNPQAGRILEVMSDLAAAGIEFHTQVVLCPGLNDGPYLEKTVQDLSQLPGVLSLAIVPVGLTSYREKLPQLQTFERENARQVVRWVHTRQDQFRQERGTAFLWVSDEFYLQAGEALPPYEAYEDFPQLENGVGMVRLFWEEFEQSDLPQKIAPAREYIVATGVSGRFAMEPVIEKLNKIPGLSLTLRVIENTFFGPSVTVTGLLTGSCLLEGLQGLAEGSTVIIPRVLLEKQEGKFLDNLTPQQVAEKLKINFLAAPMEGQGLLDVLREGDSSD